MNIDLPRLEASRTGGRRPPMQLAKGLFSAFVAYPLAEQAEKRSVRPRLQELRRHYGMTWERRRQSAEAGLADIVEFAGAEVPYYRELFARLGFSPEKLRRDPRFIEDLPYLTKEIIREEGPRLLSKPLSELRHFPCKTGGSTGLSATIYYDAAAADRSSAVTLYCRERVGKKKYLPETHLAAHFADQPKARWPSREDFKCLAMNRSNIFFDRVDDEGLEAMWGQLRQQRPYLLHGHPSTIYALALFVARQYGLSHAFEIFEPSGELLTPHARATIEQTFGCRVVDRYGLAEFGVVAYELGSGGLRILESEVWPENRPSEDGEVPELVFTGLQNRLMPLIRYRTGDLGQIERDGDGFAISGTVGRIHDRVSINGTVYLTHHIQDVLDHRVGGIQEFQIDLRTTPPTLRLVAEPDAVPAEIAAKVATHWNGAFQVEFVGNDQMIRVGRHAKFRHVVDA